MRIFLSAGEASGDAVGAALVEAIKQRRAGPPIDFGAIGGQRLREAIGSVVVDSSSWGVVSIVQSLKILPRAYFGSLKARRLFSPKEPGLFIAIDFGFFNIRMCRIAKRRGWKTLYFMPPSSWSREQQGRDLPKVADAVVTPFPWSKEILCKIGANAHFFGHPLKQLIASAAEQERGETIAVLPGSRRAEIERNLPLIAKTMADPRLRSHQLEFALAPTVDRIKVESQWKLMAPGRQDLFSRGDTYGVLGRAKAAIVCSGTATLEAALMRCPMVVIYVVTEAMAREGKLIRFKPPKFIALPNVILDRRVVPEFAGLEVDPLAVASELLPLLADGPGGATQLKDFEEIDALLGPSDAITQTADFVLGMIR